MNEIVTRNEMAVMLSKKIPTLIDKMDECEPEQCESIIRTLKGIADLCALPLTHRKKND